MKYQFCIRYDKIDVNSAASKAVLDCNKIFSENGYLDYTFTVGDNSKKVTYYYFLLKELIRFFLAVKRDSIVGIQYPLLSINALFKYFIKALKLKGVKFFCVVHDLESLRTGGRQQKLISEEVDRLNNYDGIVVHNIHMQNWLRQNGLVKPMVPLVIFDYITDDFDIPPNESNESIVYAGNLTKSKFIYELPQVNTKHFNVYGPNFQAARIKVGSNVTWEGEFSPSQIVAKLKGSFGLIWDGTSIDFCDDILGNYLRYNNPHKFSLYIAAGLPVIAPHDSAIGAFIKQSGIGILINTPKDITNIVIEKEDYLHMVANILRIRQDVIRGEYFSRAIKAIEENIYAGRN